MSAYEIEEGEGFVVEFQQHLRAKHQQQTVGILVRPDAIARLNNSGNAAAQVTGGGGALLVIERDKR